MSPMGSVSYEDLNRERIIRGSQVYPSRSRQFFFLNHDERRDARVEYTQDIILTLIFRLYIITNLYLLTLLSHPESHSAYYF